MKSDWLIGMALGLVVGAVSVTVCKPAQNIVKKGTNLVKEETKALLNKKQNNEE